MRVAYLITAYGNYNHLRKLIEALQDPGAHFFINIDSKSPAPDLVDLDNITLILPHKVWWGGWSHTAAILELMHTAANYSKQFDYFSIMSGTDYPLRPNSELYRILETGGEFINMREGFTPDKPEKRIKYYYFDSYNRQAKTPRALLMRTLELALRFIAHKRHYPFKKVYVGTVWSVLSLNCIRYILDYTDKHPEYIKFFKTAFTPEEYFFHTIIGNSPFRIQVRTSLTYSDWSDPKAKGPALITLGHLDNLAAGHHTELGKDYDRFFSRKFTDESVEVVAAIDERLRCSSK